MVIIINEIVFMKIYVVTGASSCGKTTIIDRLAKMGFAVMHEAARELIREGKIRPRTVQFQEELAKRHLAREQAVRASGANIAFLDRGIYDNRAFCKHYGFSEIPKILKTEPAYDAAFFLNSLASFENDGLRVESGIEEALAVKNLIFEEYSRRGIPCVNVPAMNVENRVSFILKHINKF